MQHDPVRVRRPALGSGFAVTILIGRGPTVRDTRQYQVGTTGDHTPEAEARLRRELADHVAAMIVSGGQEDEAA